MNFRSQSTLANQHNSNSNLCALAVEVAAKQDEICDLRRQISSLEDEIQKTQQKIQLKANVIKELRNELKCVNTKVTKLHVFEFILQILKFLSF